jgi:hypothetical protein
MTRQYIKTNRKIFNKCGDPHIVLGLLVGTVRQKQMHALEVAVSGGTNQHSRAILRFATCIT